uniref:Translation initiation factor IF-2, chloroplastic n=1 Tax=Polysiphonia sertularioides TaxID=945028 RepID=A0A1Z1MGG0_9FLOR|nr:translation initiation factor 2 [Polysiphonia sertularioides]
MYHYKYNFFCNKSNLKKIISNLFFTECCNDILTLKNPKVIILTNSKSNSSFSFNVNSILKTEDYTKSTVSFKFDKKYKSSPSPNDKEIPKNKKGKNKLVKDKHKNDDTKNFVRNDDNLFENKPKVRSNLKVRKTGAKNKKVKPDDSNLNSIGSTLSKNESYKGSYLKSISLDGPISIQNLSLKMNIHEAEIITYLFLRKSVSATINQILDFDIAYEVVRHYGFSLSKSVSPTENLIINDSSVITKYSSSTSSRPPIITILGHVDHGKTTLLECILKANLVNKEEGGITQAICGYEVRHEYNSQKSILVFLDTPGHQSFKSMRIRGAKITDIILLVVAVDEGIKPQTLECIEYVKYMSLKCIVVVTKCDSGINNEQKIKEDLAKHGLLSDDWGGEIPFISVSAKSNYNITNLLSKICFLSSSINLLCDIEQCASGIIIDSSIDKKRGTLTSLVVKNGTLNVGDLVAAESSFGKVKRIINSLGNKIDSALPSSIVEVLCFSLPPKAGSTFYTFTNEKEAKQYSSKYSSVKLNNFSSTSLNKRVSSDLKSNKKELTLLIKADTQGSLEAIMDLLSHIPQLKVQINIVSSSLGNISNNDIELANSTSSLILAFNVNPLPEISVSIKKYQLNCQVFCVIYDLFDYVHSLMINLLDPEYNHVLIGNLNIQSVFNINKGCIAGCVVTTGKVKINSFIKVYRHNTNIYEGYIISLKQSKNDVSEVLAPNECGLMSDFYDWQKSDLIEAYDSIIKDKKL